MNMEKALEIAKKYMKSITWCEEWKYAFIFSTEKDESLPCVVLKKDSKVISWPEYIGMNLEDDIMITECEIS